VSAYIGSSKDLEDVKDSEIHTLKQGAVPFVADRKKAMVAEVK
jgi:hypothetical protein